MDIDKCDICGPHLDRIRAELLPLMTAPVPLHATPDELVDRLMLRIAPHMHAAVESAEDITRMVVPEEMV